MLRTRTSIFLLATLCSSLSYGQIKFGLPADPPPGQTAATSSAAPGKGSLTKKEFNVAAGSQWLDTGIDVIPGDQVTITSEGQLSFLAGGVTGPDGLARTMRDVITNLPVNSAGPGALIARIGENAAVVPFVVGAKKEFTISRPGRLFLGVNTGSQQQFTGGFKVSLQLTPADKAQPAQAAELKFDQDLFTQIPRRVTDKDGGSGDMVNFILVGTEKDVQQSFASAGWVQVDRTVQDALLHAVLSTSKKSSYLEMPMSELYLFGRPQDFGFARADPVTVVQTRHHLRVWKAPFTFKDQQVWIGAATHDIGFEKDQRNGKVTHKIDPNVDLERDFVRASLTEGGGVLCDEFVMPQDPVTEAKTATGGSFHSDGRVIVMQLRATAPETKSGN